MIAQIKFYGLLAVTVIAGAVALLAKIFQMGRQSEQNRQQRETLKAHRTRAEVEDEVRKSSDSNLRDGLSRWVRDDGK